jgi:hypothetical protein
MCTVMLFASVVVPAGYETMGRHGDVVARPAADLVAGAQIAHLPTIHVVARTQG